MLAMENMDAYSPAAKIVGEELDAFFERARKRLDDIREPVSLEESEKEIRKLVEFRLGYPTAKTVTGKKRSRTAWNEYLVDNYKRVKAESGIFPLSMAMACFSLFHLGLSDHSKLIKILSEEYKNRAPEDENDRLTISSSSTPPSALGNALLPPVGANWVAERKKLWKQLKSLVPFMSLSMLTL